jgi:hypothetical protein
MNARPNMKKKRVSIVSEIKNEGLFIIFNIYAPILRYVFMDIRVRKTPDFCSYFIFAVTQRFFYFAHHPKPATFQLHIEMNYRHYRPYKSICADLLSKRHSYLFVLLYG